MMIKLGPTGKFPNGKLNDYDQGETRIAVGVKDDNVFIDFGAPVTWIAMSPELAITMADALIKHANNVTTPII